jgi:ATP-dependent Zn protease
LRGTAHHEAGHAVVSFVLGRAVRGISIIGDRETLGRTSHWPVGSWFRPDVELDRRHRQFIERDIIILLAGVEAERKYRGRYDHLGAQPDREMVADLALSATGSVETDAYVLRLALRAERLVEDNWSAIKVVAACLLEERNMGPGRARETLQAAIEGESDED